MEFPVLFLGALPKNTPALYSLMNYAGLKQGTFYPLGGFGRVIDAMRQIAELTDTPPAEVKGTGSFYEMFKFEPVGKYLINICGTMSCALLGAEELMHHAEHKLGIKAGSTTDDGMFTLEQAECQAACTEAPCLQVNYRHRYRMTTDDLDQMIDDLRSGALVGDIPDHGTLTRVRQTPHVNEVGAVPPDDVSEAPVWISKHNTEAPA